MKKVFRFSPSPTGKLHLGSARTAMISFIMAQKHNADFVLRSEDTDAARSTLEFEQEINDSLAWLGASTKHPIIRQSEQEESGVYKDIAKTLVSLNLAYYCQCDKLTLKKMKVMQMSQQRPLGYEGTCRSYGHDKGVLRLNIGAVRMYLEPNEFGGGKDLHFTDGVYGSRHTDIRDLRDIVLMRSNTTATYIFANTIDDTITGVSNIVRGADILPQTPIQILLRRVIIQALNLSADVPEYMHVPLVLGEGGEKLSKRSPTTMSILELKEMGILPDAITQFILGVGNNSVPRDKAVSLDELTKVYDVAMNAKSNVAFSFHQLLHINKLHIRKLKSEAIDGTYDTKLFDMCKHRVNTVKELIADLKNSQDIISNFGNDLKQLKDIGFTKESCIDFRTNKLGGATSMSLDLLASFPHE